jgi:lambda repressor-like predicted transcriptional regulator
MTPAQIKVELETRKTSLAEISRQLGVSQQLTTNVIRGRTKSARVESAIAEALGKPLWRVFPDHYPTPPDVQELQMLSVPREELEAMRCVFQQAVLAINQLTA